jgi:hypothetical protein
MYPPSRHEQLVEEIADRLRRVCPDMPPERFEAMVHDIARTTLKYEGHATPTAYELQLRRRADDELRPDRKS